MQALEARYLAIVGPASRATLERLVTSHAGVRHIEDCILAGHLYLTLEDRRTGQQHTLQHLPWSSTDDDLWLLGSLYLVED